VSRSPRSRKEIDRIIHSIVVVEYKNCSVTCKAVKEHLAENEEAFVEKLRKAL